MKTKKIYFFLFPLLLVCIGYQPGAMKGNGWFACTNGKQRYITTFRGDKPIQANNSLTSLEVQKDDTKTYIGLEIPAPLTDRPEQLLKRVGYTVSYNSVLKLPNWVAWHLTMAHTSGFCKRDGIKFHEDEEVPQPRATDADYRRSGYDRGHMCPSGDNKWSCLAQEQSFLLTNVCPQDHQLNAGDWNEMESQCRRWAKRYGDIYIVAGPILFKGGHKTIGRNKVTVPEAFFKVVLCMKGYPKAIGFIYRNQPGNRPKGDYVNSVDQVERLTGIDFFSSLPDAVEREVEATCQLEDW